MNARNHSQLVLLVSLALGLLTMWASASPVGAAGDLITGGFTWCWVELDETACTGDYWPCTYCEGDYNTYCTAYGEDCEGGPVTVVDCSSAGEATGTSHTVGPIPCTGRCDFINNGSCY